MPSVHPLERLQLMIWKNIASQGHRKCELLIMLLICLAFVIVMLTIRYIELPNYASKVKYESVSIEDLDLFKSSLKDVGDKTDKFYIGYSPNNSIYNAIATDAAKKLEIDAAIGYASSNEMIQHLYNRSFIAGIDFDDANAEIKNYPKQFTFAIRMESHLRTDSNRDSPLTWNTGHLVPNMLDIQISPPRNDKDADGGIPTGYIREGFIPIQHAIVLSYLEQASNQTNFPPVDMRRFAYPKHRVDPMEKPINIMLPICIIMIHLSPCYFVVKQITEERKRGLRDIIEVMGVNTTIQWAGWFVHFYLLQFFISIISILMLTYNWIENVSIFNHSDWMLIICFMSSYIVANITFSFLLSAIFLRTNTAAIYAGVIHFSTYMIFLITSLIYDHLSIIGQLGICLFLNTGLTMGLHIILKYEQSGEGIQLNNYMNTPNQMGYVGLGHVELMLLLSAFIYMIFCLYIEIIYEDPKKFFFPINLFTFRGKYISRFAPNENEKKTSQQQEDNTNITREQNSSIQTSSSNLNTASSNEIVEETVKKVEIKGEIEANTESDVEHEASKHEEDYEIEAELKNKDETKADLEELEAESDESNNLQRTVNFEKVTFYKDASPVESKSSILPTGEEEHKYDQMPIYFDDNLSFGSLDFHTDEPTKENVILIEPDRADEVSVRILKLSKSFGLLDVLHDITLDCYKDEILVFLGLGSSGKTTLVKMMTGSLPITTGTVIINGNDIRTNRNGARSCLGFLPKHDTIFDNLSAKDHLYLFSRLHGVSEGRKAAQQIRYYLQKLNLYDMADIPARHLSKGMKRRLSLCCALAGDTKTVICDEPTFDMDIRSKYRLWDILKSEKSGRTIIITTDSCDEADMIADRIAVLYGGSIATLGTPKALYDHYLSYYYLTCVKRKKNCNVDAVVHILRQHVSEVEVHYNNDHEFTVSLPADQVSKFPKMFKKLDNVYLGMKILNYRIRKNTLEDIFMRINVIQKRNSAISTKPKSKGFKNTLGPDKRSIWKAIFYKKRIQCFHNWWLVILSLITLGLTTGCLSFVSYAIKTRGSINLPLLPIEVSEYKNVIIAMKIGKTVGEDTQLFKIAKKYREYVENLKGSYSFRKIPSKKLMDHYIEYRFREYRLKMDSTFLVALLVESDFIQCLWNNYLLHTAPLSLALLHKALAKFALGEEADVKCINKPLPVRPYEHAKYLKNNIEFSMGTPCCIVIGVCLELAVLAIPVIKENISYTKNLQLMSGITVLVYWTFQFIWDYITYFLSVVILIIVLAILQIPNYNTSSDWLRICVVMMIFGLTGIPFMYLLTFLFDSVLIGFISIFFIGLSTSVFLVLAFVATDRLGNTNSKIEWIIHIFPMMNLFCSLRGLHIINDLRSSCETFFNYNDLNRSKICVDNVDFFDMAYPGILAEIICMLANGFFFIIILFSCESTVLCRLIRYYVCRMKIAELRRENFDDDDVFVEHRIALAMSKMSMRAMPLVAKGLNKSYFEKDAVKNISFIIRPQDCFVVVGSTGAGKTTLIEMLTGRHRIDSGNAYINGLSITNNYSETYKSIEYFPKTSTVFDELTGRETLRIFCILHAAKETHINKICNELAKKFYFLELLDVLVSNYPLRCKRSLYAAIAVLDQPKIILMDEPSINIDPAEREKMWNMIAALRESGHSVMITTKSITECQAICTRMAIMVNGSFKCFGTVAHLKEKYSKGFTLKIQMARVNRKIQFDKANESLETLNNSASEIFESMEYDSWQEKAKHYRSIKQFFDKALQDVKLKGQYDNCLIYFLPLKQYKLWMIFFIMEAIKDEFNVESYDICQTSLEEIYKDISNSTLRHEKQNMTKSLIKYLVHPGT